MSRPEPATTVPRSVAEVLDDHATAEIECIDRMYLNLYQPKLVCPSGVVGFLSIIGGCRSCRRR